MNRPTRRTSRQIPASPLPRPNSAAREASIGGAEGRRGPTLRDIALMVAAAASTGAGAIHFAVMGHEWDEHLVSGLLLAGFAWLQVMWAAGIRSSPSAVMIVAGSALQLVAIVAWLLHEATGIGPDYTSSRLVGLSTVMLEMVAVGAAATALRASARPTPSRRAARFACWCARKMWTTWPPSN